MKYNYGNHEVTPEVMTHLVDLSRTTLHSLGSLKEAFKICGDIETIEMADRLNVSVTTLVDTQNHLYRMYHPHEIADTMAKLTYSMMEPFEKVALRFFCRKERIPLREGVKASKEFYYQWDAMKLTFWKFLGRPILKKVVIPLNSCLGGRFPRR